MQSGLHLALLMPAALPGTSPSDPPLSLLFLRLGKVRLHRYICLWWASERKLGKKPVTKPKKTLEKSREQG